MFESFIELKVIIALHCEETVKSARNADEIVKFRGIDLKKVVILEDEPSISDALSFALQSDGFEPVVCSTIKEAKLLLETIHFSLGIFDIGLPDGNGLEFLKTLRQESALPVIILSSKSSDIDRILGLEFGADDYVGKPFSPREVVARVRAVLRRAEDSKPTKVIDIKNFVVDQNRHLITYHGKELDLSRYEFRLLEALIAKPGWVFSREKLMNICWESPEASMERTVDTHVKTIRAKLRAIKPEPDPIITHRGIGYSLSDIK